VGPVLAHAVARSADNRLAADMTMWIGAQDQRGGPLAVPCMYIMSQETRPLQFFGITLSKQADCG